MSEALHDPGSNPRSLPGLALIGPLLPFRGGIAQHTTRLHRALRACGPLRTVSFSRMYPAWLFPGASDRDADHAGHSEVGVDYVIDSLNPLSWLRAARRVLGSVGDAVLRHAPCSVLIVKTV